MRYKVIDEVRGITLISMMIYHMVWDMVYIYAWDFAWFQSSGAYVWQQSICWTFILISGFCWSMGKKKWKRGLTVFGAGILISVVTMLFMPQDRIVFGVLTLLGSCMLFLIPLEQGLNRVPCWLGLGTSMILFLLFRNVNEGYLGFEKLQIQKLPETWYQNMATAYLGFPSKSFFSTDYFSVIPWIFLFLTGYFVYRLLAEKEKLQILCKFHFNIPILETVGRHSLMIYLWHQPVIYFILLIANKSIY